MSASMSLPQCNDTSTIAKFFNEKREEEEEEKVKYFCFTSVYTFLFSSLSF
jgi:hypothetical protein